MSALSGRPKMPLERRRVRFGKWKIPLSFHTPFSERWKGLKDRPIVARLLENRQTSGLRVELFNVKRKTVLKC